MTDEDKYILDGYHRRLITALKEADWHMRHLSASQAIPVHWEVSRLKVIDRSKELLKELEQFQ